MYNELDVHSIKKHGYISMIDKIISAGRSRHEEGSVRESEEILMELFQLLATTPSDVFLNYFTQNISEKLDVAFVSICFTDKQFVKKQSLAIWSEGLQVEDTFSYNKGYETLLDNNFPYAIVAIDEAILNANPDIINKRLKSYLIYPVQAGEEIIGFVEVFAERVLDSKDKLIKIIDIFLPRINGELLRIKGYEEMKNEYKKYKDIFDQCPIGIILENEEGDFDYNLGLSKMFGFDYFIEKLNSKDLFISFEAERKSEVVELISNEKENYQNEVSLVKKDGERIHIKLTMVNIFDNNTQSFRCLSVIEDITAAKIVQKALDERNELFRKLYENCPIGIVISQRGKMLNVNPKFCEMLRYTEQEILQFSTKGITCSEDSEVHLEKYEAMRRGEIKGFSMDKRYVNKYGDLIWARVIVSAVKDNNEETLFTITMIEDITEQQKSKFRLKEKLQELDEKNTQLKKYIDSNLQLENFAYIASHDLKEPLRTIGNFAQLLGQQLRGILSIHAEEYLNFVISGVQDMNHLIDDLLTYSLVNKQDHEFETIDLPRLLNVIVKSLEKSIQDKNVQIVYNNIPPEIKGNRTKIKQVFKNLITKAIKFSKADDLAPQIVISCGELSKEWQFEVRDFGIGINPGYHQKIFRLFQKLHAKHEYEGTGIGLAICKKIVEQHDGTIWVESELGKGTTFFFTIIKSPEGKESYLLS